MNRLTKYLNGKKYQAKLNLRSKIESEVFAVLRSKQRAETRLSGNTVDNETQGYVSDLDKYREARNIGQNRGTEGFNNPMEDGKPEFGAEEVVSLVLA